MSTETVVELPEDPHEQVSYDDAVLPPTEDEVQADATPIDTEAIEAAAAHRAKLAEESEKYERSAARGHQQTFVDRQVAQGLTATGLRRSRTYCAPSSRAVLMAHRASESNFAELSDESLVANFRSCKQRVDAAK